MWQIFSLGSMLFNSIENVVDKSAIVKEKQIDDLVATFIRLTFYVLFVWLVGTIFLGDSSIYISPLIIAFGIISAFDSFVYTFALKKIEITSLGVFGYLDTLAYLFIDYFILKTNLSNLEITGVILLVIGGILFSIDAKTYRFKKELSPKVILVILFFIVYSGIEAYLFKYMHMESGVSGPTFLVSTWLIAWTAIFVAVIFKRKTKFVFTDSAKVFAKRSLIAKSFDSFSSVLNTQALLYASVAQVTAMGSIAPLILLSVAIVAQMLFKIPIEEKFDTSNLLLKIVAMAILVFGAVLIG